MPLKSSTEKSNEWQHGIKCLLNSRAKQGECSRMGRKRPCCDFPGFPPKSSRRIPCVPCCIPPLPLRVELTLCSANAFPQRHNPGFLLSLAPSPKHSWRLQLHPSKYPAFACSHLRYLYCLYLVFAFFQLSHFRNNREFPSTSASHTLSVLQYLSEELHWNQFSGYGIFLVDENVTMPCIWHIHYLPNALSYHLTKIPCPMVCPLFCKYFMLH